MLFNFNPTQTPEEGTEEVSVWITDTLSYFTMKDDSLYLNARGMYNFNYRDFRGTVLIALENINGAEDDNCYFIIYDTEDEEGKPIEPGYGFIFGENQEVLGCESVCYLKNDSIKPGTYI